MARYLFLFLGALGLLLWSAPNANAWTDAQRLTGVKQASLASSPLSASSMPSPSLFRNVLVHRPSFGVVRQASDEVAGFLLGLELVLRLGPGVADIVGLTLNVIVLGLGPKASRYRLIFGITGITVAVLTGMISLVILASNDGYFVVGDGIFMGVRALELGLGVLNVVLAELHTSGRRLAFLPWVRGERTGGVAGGLTAVGMF
ncbi:MAG: hypothetical protein EP343_15925 [Deltaproteobacteria bacterium]|nr:MAG: hypothetical protein EP343_15925 [Deltaproteobacteria bacterium]